MILIFQLKYIRYTLSIYIITFTLCISAGILNIASIPVHEHICRYVSIYLTKVITVVASEIKHV